MCIVICKIGTMTLKGSHSFNNFVFVSFSLCDVFMEWFICGLVIEVFHCLRYVLLSWTTMVEALSLFIISVGLLIG